MKTMLKVLSGAAVAAVLLGASAGKAEAGSSWAIGVGYQGSNVGFAYRSGGGCAPRYGYGWSGAYRYRHYAPAPVVYYRPAPVVYYAPPPPPQTTVVYTTPAPAPQTPAPAVAGPMTVADVKLLTKAGVSDEVIISQIRSSQTVFRLSTAAIIELKDNDVSQRVIDFMINTANQK